MRQAAPTDTESPTEGIQDEAQPKGSAIAGLSLTMLMPSLAISSANAALPELVDAFGTSFQAVQWVVLSYMLAITTTIVAVGRAGDVIGRKRLMIAGVVIFVTASFLSGLSPDLSVLVAARSVQGFGAAIMMALAMTFIGELYPKQQTGRAMGLLGTMSAVGTTMGPSLGGILIAFFGWQAVFLINVPIGLAAIFLLRRGLPAAEHSPTHDSRGFDVAGILLLVITLGSYAVAMTIGHGRFSGINIALLIVALGTGAMFVVAEARAASPIVDLGLFRNTALSAGFVANAAVSTVIMATLVVGPFYLTRALQLDAARAGILLSVGPLVASICGFPAGRLVDRVGTVRASRTGLLIMIAGSIGLSLIDPEAGIVGYLIPIALLTAGYATFQAANNTAIMSIAGPSRRGILSGLLNLSRNIGLLTGASVMGAVFMAGIGGDIAIAPPAAITAGVRTTFAVAIILAAVAIAVGRPRSRDSVS